MNTTQKKIYSEAADLYNLGVKILKGECYAQSEEELKKEEKEILKAHNLPLIYQEFYSKALNLIKVVMPERLEEFKQFYICDKRKEIDFLTYTIKDYLLGVKVTRGLYKEEVVNPLAAFTSKLKQQLMILHSCLELLKSKLKDIESVLQYNLFENEIEGAQELLKKGHLRASGVLADVTLESHLKTVFANHGIKTRKKNLTISDCNDALKNEGVIDVPMWRLIQRLGDIRNLCAHSKERDPIKDEVEDLISGTHKIIAEVN